MPTIHFDFVTTGFDPKQSHDWRSDVRVPDTHWHECLEVRFYGVLGCTALPVLGQSGALTHRYSSASDANDSVGQANGVLNGGATVLNGLLASNALGTNLGLPANLTVIPLPNGAQPNVLTSRYDNSRSGPIPGT